MQRLSGRSRSLRKGAGTAAARLPSTSSGPEPVEGSAPKSDGGASPPAFTVPGRGEGPLACRRIAATGQWVEAGQAWEGNLGEMEFLPQGAG